MKDITIFPIGYVENDNGKASIHINQKYIPAIKELDKFSHVIVIWWAHESEVFRNEVQLTCEPPYGEGTPETGIFATRSEYRPNPIAITTCHIIKVDMKKGIVEVGGLDAFDKTPVLDLKAYFPICDRVKNVQIAPWLKDWPDWLEDGLKWWEEQGFFEEEIEDQPAPKSKAVSIPTTGRLGRLAKLITEGAGEEISSEIMNDWKTVKTAKADKKAQWVETVMERLVQKIGKERARVILQECGRTCIKGMSFIVKAAKAAAKKKLTPAQFVDEMQKKYKGSSFFELKDDHTIIAGRYKCYCMVKAAKKPFKENTYCECGAGGMQQFIEMELNKPVEVEILESVISGGETCKFKLTF